jgi:hypothetical protein
MPPIRGNYVAKNRTPRQNPMRQQPAPSASPRSSPNELPHSSFGFVTPAPSQIPAHVDVSPNLRPTASSLTASHSSFVIRISDFGLPPSPPPELRSQSEATHTTARLAPLARHAPLGPAPLRKSYSCSYSCSYSNSPRREPRRVRVGPMNPTFLLVIVIASTLRPTPCPPPQSPIPNPKSQIQNLPCPPRPLKNPPRATKKPAAGFP